MTLTNQIQQPDVKGNISPSLGGGRYTESFDSELGRLNSGVEGTDATSEKPPADSNQNPQTKLGLGCSDSVHLQTGDALRGSEIK